MSSGAAGDWLQAAINASLALDPEIKQKLSPLAGCVICIKLKDVERDLYLFPHEQGIDIKAHYDGAVDTTLSGTPLALLKMGMSKQTAPLLLKGEVSIEGNTQLGREFKKTLASLNIDWEELAAKSIGDVSAHQLFKTVRGMRRWGRHALGALIEDTSEYLQEESRDVVSAAELKYFYHQVDELRDAVARIEKEFATTAPDTTGGMTQK